MSDKLHESWETVWPGHGLPIHATHAAKIEAAIRADERAKIQLEYDAIRLVMEKYQKFVMSDEGVEKIEWKSPHLMPLYPLPEETPDDPAT